MPHDFKRFPELTNNQMQFYYFDSPHKQITEDFRARVVKVTDGDTIRVEWSERDFNFPVRFANINAPEMNKEGGERSRSWLASQIDGEEIEVLVNPAKRTEKWGRLLAEIIHDGLNVGEMSLMWGYSGKFGEENGFEFRE